MKQFKEKIKNIFCCVALLMTWGRLQMVVGISDPGITDFVLTPVGKTNVLVQLKYFILYWFL